MNTTVKIALINVHSTYNAGDAALTQAALDQLKVNFPNSDISLIMNDPDSYTGVEKVLLSILSWLNRPGSKPFIRFIYLVFLTALPILTFRVSGKTIYFPFSRDIQPTIDTLIKSDLIVSVPGGYYYSYGKGRAFLYLNYTLLIPILANKPLYMLPQSFGPLKKSWEVYLSRWVLNKSRILMAREPVSYQFLAGLPVDPKKLDLLPDMAFAFQGKQPEFGEQWLINIGIEPFQDRPLMGMTVIDWEAQYNYFNQQAKYEKVILAGINNFIEKYKGTVILFPQCSGPDPAEDDRLPSMKLKKASGNNEKIIVVETPLNADQLISAYSQMDIFIGTRMHSNIFALIGIIPVIAIGYLHKTSGIAKMVGIEDWVMEIREMSESELINKIDNLLKKRNEYVNQLKNKMPTLVKEANKAGILIRDDYASLRKKKNDKKN